MREPGRRDATADGAGRKLDGWRAGGGGKNCVTYVLKFIQQVYICTVNTSSPMGLTGPRLAGPFLFPANAVRRFDTAACTCRRLPVIGFLPIGDDVLTTATASRFLFA